MANAPLDPAVAEFFALPERPDAIDDASRTSILSGLRSAGTPRISQVYLYDDAGSKLYDEITNTDEYYLTETESMLLREHAADIAAVPGASSSSPRAPLQVVIELGAGECTRKTLLLLEALLPHAERTVYAPIDISASALEHNVAACAELARSGPLDILPFVGRFEDAMPQVAALGGRRLFLFLGSSLGNFGDDESVELLALVRKHMGDSSSSGGENARRDTDDRFIIGVDLPHSPTKPAEVIAAAYNDGRGVTAAFTLNALRHVNSVAGLDFDWRHGWRHVAEYDAASCSILTHVAAIGPQTVRDRCSESREDNHVASGGGGGGRGGEAQAVVRSFADGERIFMEMSRKFGADDMASFARRAGLHLRRQWASPDAYHLLVELTPTPTRSTAPPAPPPSPPPGTAARRVAPCCYMLSSLTPHTGNAVTSARISAALPVGRVVCVDVASLASPNECAAAIAQCGAALAIGVHAYRAGRLLLRCGVPFIIILGGTDMNEHLHEEAKGRVIRDVLAAAAAIIAFDANLSAKLRAAVPESQTKLFHVPQAVAVTDCATDVLRLRLGVAPADRLLLLPAGLREVKDVLFGVEALVRWREERAAAGGGAVCVRIVGPSLDAAYEAVVMEALRDMAPAAAYCGSLPREELHAAMRLASAVLNTSRSEGMCNSLLEAMAIGTPVIARANAGNSALVADGETGLLFSTPDGLVDAAKRLLADEGLSARIAAAARAQIEAKHSATAEAAGYARVVEFVMRTPDLPLN